MLNEVIETVTNAMGLQFRVDGPSTEAPSETRLPYRAERYPERWAPVLVAWSDPESEEEVPFLDVRGGRALPVDVNVPAHGIDAWRVDGA